MQYNKRKLTLAFIGVLVISIIVLYGCASIIKGAGPQSISIKSNPTGASVKIIDARSDSEIGSGITPYIIPLKASAGFFRGAKYKIRLEKEGCKDCEVMLEARPSGWYIAGNLVFGGLIGWLIVDPATGAMWVLDPKQINTNLQVNKTMWPEKQGILIALRSEFDAKAPGVLKSIAPIVPPSK